MKPRGLTVKSIALTFVLALVFYFIAYSWLSQRQVRKGPWQVVFTSDPTGVPVIVITQPNLGLSNVTLRFPEEKIPATSSTSLVLFDTPQKPVPFGTLLYDDLMFLPGIVTFDLFGHEIELQLHDVVLNRSKHPWQSGETISLWATNKLPASARIPKKKMGYAQPSTNAPAGSTRTPKQP